MIIVALLFLCQALPGQPPTGSPQALAIPKSETIITDPEFTGAARVNIGQSVNSRLDEVNPILSPDGAKLYFARKNAEENVGGRLDPQDIWISAFDSVEGWRTPHNAGRQINTEGADNLTAISSDNRTLYFYVAKGEVGKFQYRTKTHKGWSAAKDLGVQITNESRFLESCMSEDGNVILFTAKTPDNVRYQKQGDERDIYICFQTSPGIWSPPINAGKTINTSGDEFSPFLASDGRTLYFASNGHQGFGNADIFVSRRMGTGWTNWTQPENLGPPFNTHSFDAYFRLMSDETTALFVSHLTLGKSDIFEAKVPARFSITSDQAGHQRNVIFFDASKAIVKPEYDTHLKNIALLLNSDRQLKIEIHGHTDNQGTENALSSLSRDRCLSIREYLELMGVRRKQIRIFPHGGASPATSNDTELHRIQNRRVEIRLVRNHTVLL